MRVFAFTGFPGHWPVGTAAVVVASSKLEALRQLNVRLEEKKIGPAVAGECSITEVDVSHTNVQILCDGNY